MNNQLKGYIFLAGYHTLGEFAKECGISFHTLVNILHQYNKPSLSMKIKIIKALNSHLNNKKVSLYEIFPDTEKIDPEIIAE